MIELLLTTVAPAVFGAGLRLWNEGRRDKREKQEMKLLAQTKNAEVIAAANARFDKGKGAFFRQLMVALMVTVALVALIGLPLYAAIFDIPLFVTVEYYKEVGFLFWKSFEPIMQIEQINGLWLDPEFGHIVRSAVFLFFGNVVAGAGRR